MENNIQLFEYHNKSVRTVIINGEVWWVAKDVCELLGYKDHSNAIKLHCKGVAKYHPLYTPGGTQELRIISRPDLLRLITNSELPEAVAFEKWIFEEVLPQIWKTGSYGLKKPTNLELAQMVIDAETKKLELIKENTALSERVDTLVNRSKDLAIRNKNLAEADDIVKTFIDHKGLISVDDFAKIVKIRMKHLRGLMDGVIYKRNGKPYVNIVLNKWMDIKEVTVDGVDKPTEFFTPRGAMWFYKNYIKVNKDNINIQIDDLEM